MKKRVFVIHGWGGSTDGDWIPWVRQELEGKEREVIAPEMPESQHPKMNLWLSEMEKAVGKPRAGDMFIGHSIGCQTILRFVEKYGEKEKADRLILIAPWWFLKLASGEDKNDAAPWLDTMIDFGKVKEKVNKIICVFSEDDPYVPLSENSKFFIDNLGAEVKVVSGYGHFTADDGVMKLEFLPELVTRE